MNKHTYINDVMIVLARGWQGEIMISGNEIQRVRLEREAESIVLQENGHLHVDGFDHEYTQEDAEFIDVVRGFFRLDGYSL